MSGRRADHGPLRTPLGDHSRPKLPRRMRGGTLPRYVVPGRPRHLQRRVWQGLRAFLGRVRRVRATVLSRRPPSPRQRKCACPRSLQPPNCATSACLCPLHRAPASTSARIGCSFKRTWCAPPPSHRLARVRSRSLRDSAHVHVCGAQGGMEEMGSFYDHCLETLCEFWQLCSLRLLSHVWTTYVCLLALLCRSTRNLWHVLQSAYLRLLHGGSSHGLL